VEYETQRQDDSLWAGAAQVEITPPPGTHLSGRGDGGHRPAEVVLDPAPTHEVALVEAVLPRPTAHGPRYPLVPDPP